jgi:hypothetical protein
MVPTPWEYTQRLTDVERFGYEQIFDLFDTPLFDVTMDGSAYWGVADPSPDSELMARALGLAHPLARSLARSILHAEAGPIEEQARALARFVAEFRARFPNGPLRKGETFFGPGFAHWRAGEFVCEAALEASGHSIRVECCDTGGYEADIERCMPARCCRYVLRYAYARAEAFADAHPLLGLEQLAARWWFDCWSAELDDGDDDCARVVRAREWFLIDRPAVALGVPPMRAFCRDRRFRVVPPLQAKLLTDAAGSEPSLYMLSSHADGFAKFDDHRGWRFEVDGVPRTFAPERREAAIGRVLRLRPEHPATERWGFASTGVSYIPVEDMDLLADAMLALSGCPPPPFWRAIVLECWRSMAAGVELPRPVRAAPDHHDPGELLERLEDARAEGHVRRTSVGRPGSWRPDDPNAPVADAVLEMWWQALESEAAGIGEGIASLAGDAAENPIRRGVARRLIAEGVL